MNYPRLRRVNFQPILHDGATYYALEDRFSLSEQQVCLPYLMARMATNCDGTRSVAQLHQMLVQEIVQSGSPETAADLHLTAVQDTIQALDDHFLLDNARSVRAIAEKRRIYQDQPFRPPLFAGKSYPDHATTLHPFLEQYSINDHDLATWQAAEPWHGRGLISPHIDYERGGNIYAKVWQRAREAIDAADLILIFATDHHGGPASLTLSSLPYTTPYGILPTDQAIVRGLESAIGTDEAYALELNHMQEHSIELVTTWLHHVRRDLCPVVPILVGSFQQFTPDGHPLDDPKITRFLTALQRLTADYNVFSIASVDLAHVGPAFGNDYEMDDARRAHLAQADQQLIDAVSAGDAERWYQQLAQTSNANHVCGFSPTYLMMKFLGETKGVSVGYEQCAADATHTSTVSICGMLLS